MKLIVHELGTTGPFGDTNLRQRFKVGEDDLDVYAIRPHLYKHLAPAGSLYVQIQDAENGFKIADSETIAISALTAVNYFHGYVRFLINVTLKANTGYRVALKSTGYTYSSTAFIGWCSDYDLRKVTANYLLNKGVNAPLDYEIWINKQIPRGVS